MDDDIRNRLRGGGRESYSERPVFRPRPPQPQPTLRPKPVVRPIPRAEPAAKPKIEATAKPFTKPPTKPKPIKTRKKRSKKAKRLMVMVLLLLIAVPGGYLFYKSNRAAIARKKDQVISQAAQQLGEIKPTGTIRLIATGDNLTFDSINNAAKQPDGSYDYAPLYGQIKPFFDKSDIRICNQSVPAGGVGLGISGFPNFNAPSSFAKGLADVGCNVINLGTRHMNDKGQPGIDASVSYWSQQSGTLAYAGANRSVEEQGKIRYFTVKQVKFAFLSYATLSNNAQLTPHGINIYNDTVAQKQIDEARKNAQLVIVSMNWGTENSGDINADQDRIAQSLADYGADIILGTGPQVLQPTKILNGKQGHQTLVWFSLGNLLNSQVPVENLVGGIAIMNIDVATQHLTDPAFLPVYMHYEWTAEQKKRQSQPDLLARHGFMLYPLDKAAEPLAKSQNNTTVQAQTDRVKGIITKFAPIKIITSNEF